MRKAPHFLCTFIKGTQSFSREALVEVISRRKRGKEVKFHKSEEEEEKRENIEALYELLIKIQLIHI